MIFSFLKDLKLFISIGSLVIQMRQKLGNFFFHLSGRIVAHQLVIVNQHTIHALPKIFVILHSGKE